METLHSSFALAPVGTRSQPLERLVRIVSPWLLAAVASMLSLLRTGFNFNVSNNEFHVPIVLRFADMPQFSEDPFVLSLRHFVSPVYPLLSLVATDANVANLFLIGLVITHLLTFRAWLHIGTACGIGRWHEQISLVLFLAAISAVYGVSPVGADGLLMGYFTHTELAQAVALFAIGDVILGRLLRASALTGIAFAINAFVGVWTLAPVAGAIAWQVARPLPSNLSWTARLRLALMAAAAFALLAASVVVWIMAASSSAVVDFDYRAFLKIYGAPVKPARSRW
jgi:hypothetical protein